MKDVLPNFKSHIRELDGVRGFALLLVLVWHYVTCQHVSKLGGPMPYLIGSTRLFWSGVDLFFVLSGLLIGGIMIDNAGKTGFLRAFYIRRAARILPVYVLLLTLYFIARSTLDHESFGWLFHDAIPDLAYLTFTQNVFMGLNETFGGNFLGITWSLAVEEQFYLMIPIVLVLVGLKRFLPVVILLALCAPFLRLAVPSYDAIVHMPCRMDALLMGVILAFTFRSKICVEYLDRNKRGVWVVFSVLLFGMALMTWFAMGRYFLEPLVIAMFYASFITLAILYRGTEVTAILRSNLLVKLGLYSYGIYMFHQMVAGLIHGYFRGGGPIAHTFYGIFLTVCSTVLTIALAVISYHTYETFFLKKGRRFKYDGSVEKQ